MAFNNIVQLIQNTLNLLFAQLGIIGNLSQNLGFGVALGDGFNLFDRCSFGCGFFLAGAFFAGAFLAVALRGAMVSFLCLSFVIFRWCLRINLVVAGSSWVFIEQLGYI